MSFRPFRLRVHTTERISPSFIRITFTGEELSAFHPPEPVRDLRIKLIFPGTAGGLPQLPGNERWYEAWTSLADEARGHMRTYSVRGFNRPDLLLTIDFVLHLAEGATGPASTWAAAAGPGDELLLVGPSASTPSETGVEFLPGAATDLRLLGDETAAPAIARILEDLPADSRGQAYIEVPTSADQLPISSPSGITVTWLPRDGADHGRRLLDLLRVTSGPSPDEGCDLVWETPTFSASGEQVDVDKQPADVYYWIAGESTVVTTLRRHLVKEQGVHRSQVSFMGYWKQGVAMRG